MGRAVFDGQYIDVTTVFDLVEKGVLQVNIGQRRPLTDIVDVHRALEAGETTGSTLLIP